MQILFVHPNFPAQFGPVLSRLRREPDVECVFATAADHGPGNDLGVPVVRYQRRGGATRSTHYCSRTFENAVWQAHAVYEACRDASGLKPDLVVGHSGFGSTLYLRELFDCPVLGLFEYYYRPRDSDMDFRPDFPPSDIDYLRCRTRNAMLLLDLENADAGYSPTAWQRSRFPELYQPKLEVVHDGVDMDFWRRREIAREIAGEAIGPDTKLVTFAARGLEALRGFDVFVRVAKRIAAERSDVVFAVAGGDHVHYGNDMRFVPKGRSFRQHVLEREAPDLSRFRFLGYLPADTLADLFSISDLHFYLSAPFVLSWSLLDAMACECTVLASDVAPVAEFVADGKNGRLVDFFDEDAMVERALEVLEDPDRYRALGCAARETVASRCGLDVVYPRLEALYRRVAERRR